MTVNGKDSMYSTRHSRSTGVSPWPLLRPWQVSLRPLLSKVLLSSRRLRDAFVTFGTEECQLALTEHTASERRRSARTARHACGQWPVPVAQSELAELAQGGVPTGGMPTFGTEGFSPVPTGSDLSVRRSSDSIAAGCSDQACQDRADLLRSAAHSSAALRAFGASCRSEQKMLSALGGAGDGFKADLLI